MKRDNAQWRDRTDRYGQSARARICLLLWAAAWLTTGLAQTARADARTECEYQVKAAFLYNLVKFVNGARFSDTDGDRNDGQTDPNEPIVIGILGTPPTPEAFASLHGKQVRNRPVVVRRFRSIAQPEETKDDGDAEQVNIEKIKKCHVLFVCPSEKAYLRRLLAALRTNDVLTVGDVPGFLEAGGIFNFVIEKQKVRFEINTAAAGRARIQIRSKLLRLAQRVIERDDHEEPSDEGHETQISRQ